MIHRIQAPESASPEPPAPPANAPTTAPSTDGTQITEGTVASADPSTPAFSVMNIIRADLRRHPNLRWIVPAIVIIFLMLSGVVPQATPIFLFTLYSFWVPQIWRNARRGNRKALQWKFVLGQSIARLGLPLCESKFDPETVLYSKIHSAIFTDAFACPDNVFFLENNSRCNRGNWLALDPDQNS